MILEAFLLAKSLGIVLTNILKFSLANPSEPGGLCSWRELIATLTLFVPMRVQVLDLFFIYKGKV